MSQTSDERNMKEKRFVTIAETTIDRYEIVIGGLLIVILGLTILFAAAAIPYYTSSSTPTAPAIHPAFGDTTTPTATTAWEDKDERRVVDIQYFEDGSMLIYLDDNTKAHGMHSLTPDKGYQYENGTIYGPDGTELFD